MPSLADGTTAALAKGTVDYSKFIVASGVSGPAVGAMLREVEAWWIDQDFAPDGATLRARLQQTIAAQQ